MPRHQLTHEERSRGGKTRAGQPSMKEARSKGFWATMESHPFFARHWLKLLIKAQNEKRAQNHIGGSTHDTAF